MKDFNPVYPLYRDVIGPTQYGVDPMFWCIGREMVGNWGSALSWSDSSCRRDSALYDGTRTSLLTDAHD